MRLVPVVSVPDPMTVPTWLTAIFTGVLAVGAIVTAVFAILAFRKQSAELAILSGQADDQRATNAKLAAAAELQAQELRESLAQRETQEQQVRRRQASQVFISQDVDVSAGAKTTAFMETMAGGESPLPVIVTIHNTSSQPIYDVELLWHRGSASYGEPNPEPVPPVMPGTTTMRKRAFPPDAVLDRDGAELRFRDAAGVRWLRRRDGDLQEQTG